MDRKTNARLHSLARLCADPSKVDGAENIDAGSDGAEGVRAVGYVLPRQSGAA